MTCTTVHPRIKSALIRLLTGGGVVALALTAGIASREVEAASSNTGFTGTPTVTLGGTNIGIAQGVAGSSTDAITITNTSTGIIDWTPDDTNGTGTIDFLPVGHTANFNSGSGGDFTVLNRINPVDASGNPVTRLIGINGTVTSSISGSPGGNVWFYTPGGFVVGSSAVFDVGGLVLTSSAIDPASLGTSTIAFTGANIVPNSSITISPGATFTLNRGNSYLAIVAPRIVQGGSISVDGSSALVAAEAANISVHTDISIDAGLFDIEVVTGTSDPNGIVHQSTASTGGPASQSQGGSQPFVDNQHVYMVAVPKNQALTMLLDGNMGYAAAASVDAESSAVILSAGHNVTLGAVNAAPTGAGPASIIMGAGTYSSLTTGWATDSITMTPAGTLRFMEDTAFFAGGPLTLTVGTAQSIQGDGDLSLISANGPMGGNITLSASGTGSSGPSSNILPGRITIAGLLNIGASGFGDTGMVSLPINGAGGVGGTVLLNASQDGRIAAGSLEARAAGTGGYGASRGGDGVGGTITVRSANAATFEFGETLLDASGYASMNGQGTPEQGGASFGGSVSILASGGAITTGALSVLAGAQGGNATSGSAGSAHAGSVSILLDGGVHAFGALEASIATQAGASYGFNGTSGTYGAAQPGTGTTGIMVRAAGAGTTLAVGGSTLFDASAQVALSGTSGSILRAGNVAIDANAGGAITLAAPLQINASATSRFAGQFAISPGQSVDAQGGNVGVNALGGTIAAQYMLIAADARVGSSAQSSATPGNATGGTITISARGSGAQRGVITSGQCFSLTSCTQSLLTTNAIAGSGSVGGTASGGTISVYAQDGDLSDIGDIILESTGLGGYADGASAGRSGNGTGGTMTVETRQGQSGNATLSFGTIGLAVDGSATIESEGTEFNIGNGGTGTGGTLSMLFNASQGSVAARSVTISANGIGGAAAAGKGTNIFASGTGTGGDAVFELNGGSATIDTLTITADGLGGQADTASAVNERSAIAGAGLGGNARLVITGGALTSAGDGITVSAGGTGGTARPSELSTGTNANAASGGAGTGGTARFDITGGAVTTDLLTINALGTGGDGGNVRVQGSPPPAVSYRAGDGGVGTGGNATADLAGGVVTVALLSLDAGGIGGRGGDNATAGNGGAGGRGAGGAAMATFTAKGHAISGLSLGAVGTGGLGGDARRRTGVNSNGQYVYVPTGTGGLGGAGAGGRALLSLPFDPTLDDLRIDASGYGAQGGIGAVGGAGGAGAGGTGAGGAVLDLIDAELTVTGLSEILSDGVGGLGGTGFTGMGGMGGAGTGGDALARVTGVLGHYTANILTISAMGTGGDGGVGGGQGGDGIAGADGGDGTGGSAGMRIDTARLTARDAPVRIDASGTGGAGSNGGDSSTAPYGGTGGGSGIGKGGIASLWLDTADFRINGLTIIASGTAGVPGEGGGGIGFPGSPGDPTASPPVPPTPPTGPLQGANGGNGAGIGGLARLVHGDDGTLAPGATRAMTGAIRIEASGEQDPAFPGGAEPEAGLAQFSDTSSATGGTINMRDGQLVMVARGVGTGAGSASGIDFVASGDAMPVDFASFATGSAVRFAFDGTGGLRALGDDGGPGQVYVSAGESIAIIHAGRSGGRASLSSSGTISLYAQGDIDADAGTLVTAGHDIFAYSLGGSVDVGMFEAGRTIGLKGAGVAASSLIAGEDVTVEADDDATITSARAGDDIEIDAPGDIVIGTATTTGAGTDGREVLFAFLDTGLSGISASDDDSNIALDAGVSVLAGALTAADDISIDAVTTIDATGVLRTLGINSGGDSDIELFANGAITLAGVDAFSDFEADGSTITATADWNAGEDIELFASGTVDTAKLFAGDDVRIAAGSIFFTEARALGNGPDDENGGADVQLRADTGGIVITSASATDEIDFAAVTGITADRLVTDGTDADADGSNVVLDAGGTVDVGSITAFADLRVSAATITGERWRAGAGADLQATGTLMLDDLGAGDPVILDAGSMTVGFDTLDVDSATASGTIMFEGTGALGFTGTTTATNIDIRSGDIIIGDNALVRASGALSLVNADRTRTSYIGGETSSAGYSLSAAEIVRLRAHDVDVTLNRVEGAGSTSLGSARAPDVVVGNISILAGGNSVIAPDGTFAIVTDGKMRVTGNVNIDGLTTGGLRLRADDAMEIIAGQGAIDLNDDGDLAGVLTLSSDDIIAATSSAIADVAAASGTAARTTRLGQNDGVLSQDGMLRAGAIAMTVRNGVYIQNTGASSEFGDRRGFTANTLDITTGGANSQIVINGRLTAAQSGGTSAFDTGLAVVPRVGIATLASGQANAAGSTINGCQIANVAGCSAPEVVIADTEDTVTGPVDTGLAGDTLFPTVVVELRSFEQTGYPPLIDEPVTGAGNDDLWDAGCANDAQGCVKD